MDLQRHFSDDERRSVMKAMELAGMTGISIDAADAVIRAYLDARAREHDRLYEAQREAQALADMPTSRGHH